MTRALAVGLTLFAGTAVAAVPLAAQEASTVTEPSIEMPVAAGDDWPDPQRVQKRGVLSAKVGYGCLATLPDEIERVAIADDAIARAQIISPRELLLTALSPGRTTVHVWLEDGRRYRYVFEATRDLDLLRKALKDLDSDLGVADSPEGASLVLHGSVRDHRTAMQAQGIASAFLGPGASVINLIDYPGRSFTRDERLASALRDIDPRIRVRRLQVGEAPNPEADTYVLEGRVRTMAALVRAMTIADRQLGGTGGQILAIDQDQADRIGVDRFRGFFGGGTFSGGGGVGGGGGLVGVQGSDPRSTALATRLARGMVLTTESGRVVSLLEVDDLPQVSVSIRVMEVDRTKSRKAGVNFRIDAQHVSIGNYVSPQVSQLPAAGDPPPPGALRSLTNPPSVDGLTVGSAGNVVAAFVDQTSQILAAFDFLQQKEFARSVAEPTILTLSGELASVLVGGEVPIETTTIGQVAAVSGFFFQEFGVRLDIRPTVNDDRTVALEVAPSIVRPTAALAVGSVPGFQVQSVSTTARVPAGQSLVIGGLLSFEDGLEDRRLPGLGAIPLFRWKRRTRAERELVFVITPRLVAVDRLPALPPASAEDHNELELPDLRWPYERKHWRDEFEPQRTTPSGVPPAFLPGELDELYGGEGGTVTMAVEPEPAPAAAEAYESEYAEPETAAAAGGSWTVAATAKPCLNIRPQPRLWSDPFDCVKPGTTVVGLDERGGWEWVKVRLADGREGWMAGSYLTRAGTD